ncbi:hypothetical protein V1509DRAFT_275110 [Lipomyces kononenkoae]
MCKATVTFNASPLFEPAASAARELTTVAPERAPKNPFRRGLFTTILHHKVPKTEATPAEVHLHHPFPLAGKGKDRNKWKRFRDWVRRKTSSSFHVHESTHGSSREGKVSPLRKIFQSKATDGIAVTEETTSIDIVAVDTVTAEESCLLNPAVTKIESPVIGQPEPVIVTVHVEVSKVVDTTEEPCSFNSTVKGTTVPCEISDEVLEIAQEANSLNYSYITDLDEFWEALVWAAEDSCFVNAAVTKNESAVIGPTEPVTLTVPADVSDDIVETFEVSSFLNAAVTNNESAVIGQTEPVTLTVPADVSDDIVGTFEESCFFNASITNNESAVIWQTEPVIVTVPADFPDEFVENSEESCFFNAAVTNNESAVIGQTAPVTGTVPVEVPDEVVESSEELYFLNPAINNESLVIGQTEPTILTIPTEVSEDETGEKKSLLNSAVTKNESLVIAQGDPFMTTILAEEEESDEIVFVRTATYSRYAFHPDGKYRTSMPDIFDYTVLLSDTYDGPTADSIGVEEISILEDSWETVSTFSPAVERDSFRALDMEECEIKELPVLAQSEGVGGTFEASHNLNLVSTRNKLPISGTGNSLIGEAPAEDCEEMVILGISACNRHAFNPDCLHRFSSQHCLDHSGSFSDSHDTSYDDTSYDADAENMTIVDASWETVSTFSPAIRHDSFDIFDLEECEVKQIFTASEIGEVDVAAEDVCSLDTILIKNGFQDLAPNEPLTTRIRAAVCEEALVTAKEQCSFTIATADIYDDDDDDETIEEMCSFVTAAGEVYDDDDENTEDMCSFVTAAADVYDEGVVGDTTICNRYGINVDGAHYASMQNIRNHSVSFSDHYNTTIFEDDVKKREHDSIRPLNLKQREIRDLSVARVVKADERDHLNPAITKKSHVMGPCEAMMVGAIPKFVVTGTRTCSGYGFDPDCLHCFGPQDIHDQSASFADSYDTTTFEAEVEKISNNSGRASSFSSPAAQYDSFHMLNLKHREIKLSAAEVCNDITMAQEPCSLNRATTNANYKSSGQKSRSWAEPVPKGSRKSSAVRDPVLRQIQPVWC